MEQCESLDAEMTELRDFQCEASDAISQDDEDEVQELQNSLREAVQDQSVKPKLQCLMVDPSFSMVTVQSEDSGIVWETASSRCSTPWASESSSISEACSMEGSGTAGKITIVFDEDKIVRRRTRSGGRISRIGDRLSRPGSSRSASALGVERPEMAEVSLPNVKQETTEAEPDFEEIKSKDQQLFSLISEGYEILNIRVPSKLPTVDEEESTELQDNLSYLDQTPMIRSRNHVSWTTQDQAAADEMEILDCNQPSNTTEPPVDTEFKHTHKDGDPSDPIDYFEKFTLVDEVVPGEQAPELQQPGAEPHHRPTAAEVAPVKPLELEESFVFVSDVEIVGEHLDEVFYGDGAPADAMQRREDDGEEDERGTRARRESQRSVKESGSVLFGSEETTLKPIFISPGPPKIIDPILLEEPTAMSFMYSDLYEDAVGERRKSDEEYSEAESVTSEKSFQRCLSESEEADGYLEKFTLKDELPAVEVQAEPAEEKRQGRMMWSQTKFEMTGCLTRVVEEEDKDTTVILDDKHDVAAETENDKEGGRLSTATDGQLVSQASVQQAEGPEKGTQDWEVKQVETEPPLGLGDVPLPETQQLDNEMEKAEEHQREEPEGNGSEPSVIENRRLSQTHGGETAAVPGEKSTGIPRTAGTTRSSLSEEAAANIDTAATDHRETPAKTVSERVKERETGSKDEFHSSQSLSEVETSLLKEEDVAPERPAAVEVSTECEMAVHAVVRVSETKLDEKENQTEVQIDLQEVTPSDAEGEEREETTVNALKCGAFINEDLEAKKQNVMTYGKKESEIIRCTIVDEMHKSKTEAGTKTPLKDSGPDTQETAHVEDEVFVLVPKGQAVEMDINIGQWSEEMTESVTVARPEAPVGETREQEGNREEAETIVMNQPPSPAMNMDKRTSSGPCEAETEEDSKGDEGISSPLRSFPPQEDLSGLHWEDRDAAQVEQVDTQGGVEAVRPQTDLHRDDVVQGQEQREAVEEDAETTVESDYEMISKQDVTDIPGPELLRDAAEQRPRTGHDTDERLELKAKTEEQDSVCVFADEELIEADYEIIDAEEESQARLVAELQGMDWFCGTCERLLSEHDFVSGEHRGHEVTAADEAFEEIKEKLSDWISVLQERSENIEDLVSELELAYNSVEDQFVESEAALQAQNDEMMALVMEQYNSMSVSMEEEKKAKLEQLYDQIVSFQENIDAAKATLETTVREAETDARSPEDIHARLAAALESAMSLELGSKGLLVFEDYAKGNASSSHLTQRKGIPVPQKPSLQPQEQDAATSTSVTVYWKVNDGDVIDCFQVYCMEEPQGAVSEEYRVTVKESYCVLEELEPDKTYKVWVMAVNYTGCSLPSERLAFRTAPSVAVIDTERCTVTWDSATLRWSPGKQTPEQSYTLEYCRQYELEGEGLRSISGIKSCVHTVLLQPNENYLFYIKTVNEAGASDQSEAALISTKGTRFHLLKSTAHPALELSADQTTVHYTQDAHKLHAPSGKRCPSVLGELLPARGYFYWETIVSGCAAYRLGVVYATADKSSSLGENRLSWCLQCIPTPSGCRYQLLHNDIQSSVFVIDSPERVGTLLDYQLGRLCFYNAVSGQLLGVFRQHFSQLCHPALALEMPGSLQVCMTPEVPEFTKES